MRHRHIMLPYIAGYETRRKAADMLATSCGASYSTSWYRGPSFRMHRNDWHVSVGDIVFRPKKENTALVYHASSAIKTRQSGHPVAVQMRMHAVVMRGATRKPPPRKGGDVLCLEAANLSALFTERHDRTQDTGVTTAILTRRFSQEEYSPGRHFDSKRKQLNSGDSQLPVAWWRFGTRCSTPASASCTGVSGSAELEEE